MAIWIGVAADPDFTISVLASMVHDVCTLATGTILCYMGYSLFKLGIVESAGDAEGKAGRYSFILKRGAPRTFCALFGVIAIVAAIWRTFNAGLRPRRASSEIVQRIQNGERN